MTSKELREKFLKFFKKNGHAIVPSSSLIPTDPSVLFTTAGMQQFKPYYLGEPSPYGPNVATCQKCFRTSDIDEVGDERHLTFFEMLGNFSFGGYWKKEAIQYAYDFLVKEIGLRIDYVSVFGGEGQVPADEESEKIWQAIDPSLVVKKFGRADNFWGPTGDEGPCGPTTEVYVDGIEVWNIVFNQYYQDKNKNLTESSCKGIDTGMGLERLAKVSQKVPTVFETDLFQLKSDSKEARIIADHVKAAVFLISEGILPSNVERGYILRRILRRAIRYGKILDLPSKVIETYQDIYPELKLKEADILRAIEDEEEKFEKTLEQGLIEMVRWWHEMSSWKESKNYKVDFEPWKNARDLGKKLFFFFQTYGFPLDLSIEELEKLSLGVHNFSVWKEEIQEGFEEAFKKHQELSRTASSGMFKGGLADSGEKTVKYHTANHLLLASLRQTLGDHVFQKGSNINAERLRFDFLHPYKMTEEEIKKVEDLVNQKIKEDLLIVCEEMPFNEAKEKGAMGVFESKYGEKVKVYTIGDFSKEICGGPHVKKTGELGHFKIIKEESSSSGVRRIRAVLVY